MKIYRILYGVLGVIFLTGTIITGNSGLSAENKAIYEVALNLQEDVNRIGFPNFDLEDYKVRFFDGRADYVVSGGTIEKDDAVFTTFVGTTYEVDGEYQIILPTVENFSAMFDLLGNAGSLAEGSMNFTQSQYGPEEHISTLWHETLHAYQMSCYYSELTGLLGKSVGEGNIEGIVVSSIDGNQNVVELYKKQMELLHKAFEARELTEKKAIVADYLKLEQQRRGLLSEEACAVEDYYEAIEGTACYMESRVYGFQKGLDALKEAYMGQTGYEKGSAKYYTSGMMKCYLLDELAPGWQSDYDFSISLNEMLMAL